MAAPLFQHRHYVAIAAIIATLPECYRDFVATWFASKLRGTNPNFSQERFLAAAKGQPARKDTP